MSGKYHPPKKAPSETRRISENERVRGGEMTVLAHRGENITVQVKQTPPSLYVLYLQPFRFASGAGGKSEGRLFGRGTAN